MSELSEWRKSEDYKQLNAQRVEIRKQIRIVNKVPKYRRDKDLIKELQEEEARLIMLLNPLI